MKVFTKKVLQENLGKLRKADLIRSARNGREYLPFHKLVRILCANGYDAVSTEVLGMLSPSTLWLPGEKVSDEEPLIKL